MPSRKDLFTGIAGIILVVGIAVAGPFNWFFDNQSGTHFDVSQFTQPISLLGMALVIAAFVVGLLAKRSNK
jgi:hypothetical protein